MFVSVRGARFRGCNKSGANVAKVGTHGLGGKHCAAGRNSARQRDRAIKPLTDFLNQGKRAFNARMTACSGGNSNQTVSALFNRFVSVFVVDNVVQHHTAVAVGGSVDVFTRPQAGDDDGHLVFDAHRHVVFQPVV